MRHKDETTNDDLMTPDMYWNSQPEELRQLRTMTNWGERYNLGLALSQEIKYKVDRAIMVDQEMDPATCMLVRQNNGYTWVPTMDQPPLPTTPGADLPGIPPYDPDNPPLRSIKVSIYARDYPPQPDIPPAPVPQSPVGKPTILPDGTVAYLPGPGLNQTTAANGDIVKWEGVSYIVNVNYGNEPPWPQVYLKKQM